MIVQKGRYFQMWKTITAPSAVSCWASHGTEANPNLPRRWLKMPHCELSIQRNGRMPGSAGTRGRSGAVKRKPCVVREGKGRATREGARRPPSRVVGLMRAALLVAGEDRLHALDRLVGGPVRRPLVDGDPRHGLAPHVLVVELGEGRVLVVLEHLVLTVQEDRGRHGDVHVLLALGALVPRAPERVGGHVGGRGQPAAVRRLDVLGEPVLLDDELDELLGEPRVLRVLGDA